MTCLLRILISKPEPFIWFNCKETNVLSIMHVAGNCYLGFLNENSVIQFKNMQIWNKWSPIWKLIQWVCNVCPRFILWTGTLKFCHDKNKLPQFWKVDNFYNLSKNRSFHLNVRVIYFCSFPVLGLCSLKNYRLSGHLSCPDNDQVFGILNFQLFLHEMKDLEVDGIWNCLLWVSGPDNVGEL